MEKGYIKKKIHLALVALIFYIQEGTAFSTFPSALTSCASSTANINFKFSIDAGESIVGKRIWFFGTDKIAESNGATLTPVPSYSSRLTAYGTSGISLSNITVADAGTYTYVIVLFPTLNPFIATTSLSVQVAPLAPPSVCQVNATQSSNILTCAVNTDIGNCGTPSLNAFWVNSANTSNQIKCNVRETYLCCATSAALTCYSGSSNNFCKLFTCTDATTSSSNMTTSTTKPSQCNIELGLGLGLGFGFGIPIVITCIVFVIFKYTGIPNRDEFCRGILKGKKHEDNPQETHEVSSIQTYVGSEAHFNFMLTEDSNKSAVHIKNKSGGVVMIARGKEGRSDDPVYKDRVNFTGNTNQKLISFILRNVTLSDAGIYTAVHSDANRIIGCQMLIVKDKKSKTKNAGPPAVHTRTQNEVEPNTNSKQTNHRRQPVPPANTGFEDTPTIRPLPQPPKNSEIKDRSLLGISATTDDKPDLASETPRPYRLRPLTPKQATVQKEDASEETKKKKKKNKKYQMNVEF